MKRRFIVVTAWFTLACGDGPTVPGALATVRVTPALVQATAFGEQISLQAVGLDAAGTEIPGLPFEWSTDNPSVATVDDFGTLTTVANGQANISATSGGITGISSIAVTQEPSILTFPDPPHALLANQALSSVSVAVADLAGTVVTNAGGSVTLDVAPGSPGTLVGGPMTAAVSGGVARFYNVRPSGLGIGWRLRATWSGLAGSSNEFDVVTAFDRVTTTGSAPVGLLIDGMTGDVLADDEGFVSSATALDVGAIRHSSANNEVVVFGQNRPPTLAANVPWSLGVDTVTVTTPTRLEPDITLWIVKGPYSQQRSLALDAVATTETIWASQYAGMRFGDVTVVDATGDPDAPSFHAFDGCSRRSDMEAQIGHTDGRINIYYVERVDGGTARGRACPIGGDFAVMAESSGDELLSHEIGHLFSLTHIDHLTADFDRTNVMHSASSVRQYLTEAQIYRSHFNPNSAINQHLGLRSGLAQRACAREQVSAICPRIALRLWPDGTYPANGVSATTTAPPLAVTAAATAGLSVDRLVETFLDMSCAAEENETIDLRLAATGDASLPYLQAALDSDNVRRRLAALQGLGLVGNGGARAILEAVQRGSDTELAAEADYQLRALEN